MVALRTQHFLNPHSELSRVSSHGGPSPLVPFILRSTAAQPVARRDRDWNLFWADKDWIHSELDRINLGPGQRVNHFRNHFELTRKDLLVKNIKKYKRGLEKAENAEIRQQSGGGGQLQRGEGGAKNSFEFLNILPTTFVLPQEYSLFVEEWRRGKHAEVFISNTSARFPRRRPTKREILFLSSSRSGGGESVRRYSLFVEEWRRGKHAEVFVEIAFPFFPAAPGETNSGREWSSHDEDGDLLNHHHMIGRSQLIIQEIVLLVVSTAPGTAQFPPGRRPPGS